MVIFVIQIHVFTLWEMCLQILRHLKLKLWLTPSCWYTDWQKKKKCLSLPCGPSMSPQGSPVFLVHPVFLLCIIWDDHSMLFFIYLLMFLVLIVYFNRLLDLVVRPVPSRSVAQDESQQSPCRASTSFVASSPLRSKPHHSSSQKNLPRASELNLLETPLAVKVCILKSQ